MNRCWRFVMIKLWNHRLLDARTMNTCNKFLDDLESENSSPKQTWFVENIGRSRRAGRRARRWWCFVVVQSDTFWFLACLVDGHRIYRSATMTYFGTSVVELLCAVEIKQGRRFVHWCNCFPSQWLIHEFCNELGWFCKSLFGDCWLLIKRTHFWSSMLIASI
jgi:hypothetical protein